MLGSENVVLLVMANGHGGLVPLELISFILKFRFAHQLFLLRRSRAKHFDRARDLTLLLGHSFIP
jgi:hypothetical protein